MCERAVCQNRFTHSCIQHGLPFTPSLDHCHERSDCRALRNAFSIQPIVMLGMSETSERTVRF